jgi:hypothetical protein
MLFDIIDDYCTGNVNDGNHVSQKSKLTARVEDVAEDVCDYIYTALYSMMKNNGWCAELTGELVHHEGYLVRHWLSPLRISLDSPPSGSGGYPGY